MKCRFDKIIIIGCGKIAADILCYVMNLQICYGYQILCVEHDKNEFSRLKSICMENNVEYEQIVDREILTRRLSVLKERILIVSAGNFYIFPKSIIQRDMIEIINFHNALLPKLPGRNAPTWAIYLEEKISGATWHYVTEHIDGGNIIAQGQVALTEDIKAYELLKNIMKIAFDLFKGFFEVILQDKIEGVVSTDDMQGRKIYYSYDIPQKGICTLDMSGIQIYRLLRATDYGKNKVFPNVKIIVDVDIILEITNYRKVSREYCTGENKIVRNMEESCLYILLDEAHELRLKYKELKLPCAQLRV